MKNSAWCNFCMENMYCTKKTNGCQTKREFFKHQLYHTYVDKCVHFLSMFYGMMWVFVRVNGWVWWRKEFKKLLCWTCHKKYSIHICEGTYTLHCIDSLTYMLYIYISRNTNIHEYIYNTMQYLKKTRTRSIWQERINVYIYMSLNMQQQHACSITWIT